MNDELREWVVTLKMRVRAVEERNWEALAAEAYAFLVDQAPLAVIVTAKERSEAADVLILGQDGVRLSARYSPAGREPLKVLASCQGCWSDVPVGTELRTDRYERIVEDRCRVFCDECLRKSSPLGLAVNAASLEQHDGLF
jgi:hypothetical protein